MLPVTMQTQHFRRKYKSNDDREKTTERKSIHSFSGRRKQKNVFQCGFHSTLLFMLVIAVAVVTILWLWWLWYSNAFQSYGVSVVIVVRDGSADVEGDAMSEEEELKVISTLRAIDQRWISQGRDGNFFIDRVVLAVCDRRSKWLLPGSNVLSGTMSHLRVDVVDLSEEEMKEDYQILNKVLMAPLSTVDGHSLNLDHRTELVLLLPSDTHLRIEEKQSGSKNINDNWLHDSVKAITREGSNTIVAGPKVLYPSGKIYQCGMDLALHEHDMPTLYKRYHGHHAEYDLAQQSAKVTCTSLAGMLIKLETFRLHGGLNESLGREFSVYDLCLRLTSAGAVITYVAPRRNDVQVIVDEQEPNPQEITKQQSGTDLWEQFLHKFYREQWEKDEDVIVGDADDGVDGWASNIGLEIDKKEENAEYQRFMEQWSHLLKQRIQQDLQLNSKVAWEYGAGGCSGWFIEAANYNVALEKHVSLRIITGAHDMCEGLPLTMYESLQRMLRREFEPIDIWISHKPPDRYPTFPYYGAKHIATKPRYIVGRSMYESKNIPAHWVDQCNDDDLVDEIWVPSKFLVQAFISAGVRADKVIHVPECIDVHFYNPLTVRPMELPGRMEFNFLTIAKWEYRKGIDLLLEAYFREFTSDDNVNLFLVTYLYMDFEPRNHDAIQHRIMQIADDLNLDRDKLPSVQILSSVIPTIDMPSLYAAADAFVLPTRGEGWGLPMMEAMAMGLPTISTRFGGQLDFMNDDNSYLIDIDGFDEQVSNADATVESFARPSISHLRRLMRHVSRRPVDARDKGWHARKHIVQYFSHEAIRELVLRELHRIEKEKLNTTR